MSAATTSAAKCAQPLDMAFATERPSVLAAAATLGYLLSVVAANVATVAWPPILVTALLSTSPDTRARSNTRPPRDPVHHRSSRHREQTR